MAASSNGQTGSRSVDCSSHVGGLPAAEFEAQKWWECIGTSEHNMMHRHDALIIVPVQAGWFSAMF
jgi:hypothetical protein